MPKENISFEHFDPDLELGRILDAHGKPIKHRKKPGRKPNPPSPAQRKAQNRAAQRAFRERKRREMQEAELTVQQCMEAKNQALNELDQCKKRIEELEFENQYLKGYTLTLKLTCFAHQIQVPAMVETSAKVTKIPQQLELLLDRNMHIVPLDFSGGQPAPSSILESPLSSSLSSSSSDFFSDIQSLQTTVDDDYVLDDTLSTIAPQLASHLETSFFQQLLKTDLVMNRNQGQLCATVQESPRSISSSIEDPPISSPQPLMTALTTTESIASETDTTKDSFSPTELQQRVRHDTRIDVIPCAALRDHMILFQDFYNANELFTCLTEFVGGESWLVPESFFKQYWFLFPNHTMDNVHLQGTSTRMMDLLKKRKRMYLEKDMYPECFPNEKEHQLINDILFDDEDTTMDYYSHFLEDKSTIEDEINLNAPLEDFMALLNTTAATMNC